MQRYFVENEKDNFRLQESDFHHIKDVMRMKNGDKIICIQEGKTYLCSIEFHGSDYRIQVEKLMDNDVELTQNIILYQALIKNDKFDLVIQKACELGVSCIVPTICARSVIKVDAENENKKIMRYEKIIKEACEQSERNIIPQIRKYCKIKEIKLDETTLGLLAYERNPNVFTLTKSLKDCKKYKNIAIVIGPEGGFSEEEISYLTSIGFHNVSLGKRILRSETAAMYALSIVGHYIEGRNDE